MEAVGLFLTFVLLPLLVLFIVWWLHVAITTALVTLCRRAPIVIRWLLVTLLLLPCLIIDIVFSLPFAATLPLFSLSNMYPKFMTAELVRTLFTPSKVKA